MDPRRTLFRGTRLQHRHTSQHTDASLMVSARHLALFGLLVLRCTSPALAADDVASKHTIASTGGSTSRPRPGPILTTNNGDCTPPRLPSSRPFCYVPSTVSPPAQQLLSFLGSGSPGVEPDFTNLSVVAMARAAMTTMFDDDTRAAADQLIGSPSQDTLNGVPVVWANTQARDSSGSSCTSDAADDTAAAQSNSCSMPEGVIMYLHGGAFTLGSCSYQLPTVAVVVATTGVPVVCVEYRLAPEHPFPASLDDIFAAYKGLLGKGYSPGHILLVGDSAGAHFVAALAVKLAQEGLEPPGALGMMSPYVDFCSDQDTMVTLIGVEPLLPAPDLSGGDPCSSYTVRAYLGGNLSLVDDPLVSPLRANFSELYPGGNTLPPTLIQVGLREMLLSQAVLLYHAMKAAAPSPGNVVLSPYEAMPHVHQIHFTRLPEARAAQEEMGEFFKRALNKTSVCD